MPNVGRYLLSVRHKRQLLQVQHIPSHTYTGRPYGLRAVLHSAMRATSPESPYSCLLILPCGFAAKRNAHVSKYLWENSHDPGFA